MPQRDGLHWRMTRVKKKKGCENKAKLELTVPSAPQARTDSELWQIIEVKLAYLCAASELVQLQLRCMIASLQVFDCAFECRPIAIAMRCHVWCEIASGRGCTGMHGDALLYVPQLGCGVGMQERRRWDAALDEPR
jgi:hypothetical protein